MALFCSMLLFAGSALTTVGPRSLPVAPLSPQFDAFERTPAYVHASLISEDGRWLRPEPTSSWFMFAAAGGLLVGPGERSSPFVYDCDPRRETVCRVGRAALTFRRHWGPLAGLLLHLGKIVMRDVRAREGRQPTGLAGFLMSLPVINLCLLDNGGYAAFLFAL